MSVLSMCVRVQKLPDTVISRYSNTYAKKSEVKAPWDLNTAICAALNGHLHIFEYLVERKFDKYDVWACECAAEKGHLDCLKYLHETAKAPWDEDALYFAHENNHTECVQYLLDNNCPLPPDWSYEGGTLYETFYDSEEEEEE